jgi:hypothetical protein
MFGKRNIIAVSGSWALLLAVASLARTDAQTPRQPSGVYAKIDIETAETGCPGYQDGATDLHPCLKKLFKDLLKDTAIQGLTVGEHWDHIKLSSPDCIFEGILPVFCVPFGTDWRYLDDAFAEANAVGKTVQLIITPGVDTPLWVLAEITSCDPMFNSATSATVGGSNSNCGKVTFGGFQQETQRADGPVFPLPWNSVYTDQWYKFLWELNDRYYTQYKDNNPAFVSIAIAGPNGASDEMILPTTAYKAFQDPSGMPADLAWMYLVENSFPDAGSNYWSSDQAFVDQWSHRIDEYEMIFSGVTLVLSPDAGNYFPEWPTTVTSEAKHLFEKDCTLHKEDVDSCAAKTDILSYFVTKVGTNSKATRTGGMTASVPTALGDIGLAGVKLLTDPPTSWQQTPLLGAAEFDHPVKGKSRQKEGCLPSYPCDPKVTRAEAAYNVLTTFFNGTPVAAYYGGLLGPGNGVCGNALMHYLEVPYVDVLYAQTAPPLKVPSPIIGYTTLQDLLTMASQDLLAMAAQPPPTCPTQ